MTIDMCLTMLKTIDTNVVNRILWQSIVAVCCASTCVVFQACKAHILAKSFYVSVKLKTREGKSRMSFKKRKFQKEANFERLLLPLASY